MPQKRSTMMSATMLMGAARCTKMGTREQQICAAGQRGLVLGPAARWARTGVQTERGNGRERQRAACHGISLSVFPMTCHRMSQAG